MRLLRNILLGISLVLFAGGSLAACGSKTKNATETPAPADDDGEKKADDGEMTPDDGEMKADGEEKPDGEGSW